MLVMLRAGHDSVTQYEITNEFRGNIPEFLGNYRTNHTFRLGSLISNCAFSASSVSAEFHFIFVD